MAHILYIDQFCNSGFICRLLRFTTLFIEFQLHSCHSFFICMSFAAYALLGMVLKFNTVMNWQILLQPFSGIIYLIYFLRHLLSHYSYGIDTNTLGKMYTRFFYGACLVVFNAGYGFPVFDHAALVFTTNVWLCSRLLYILALGLFL